MMEDKTNSVATEIAQPLPATSTWQALKDSISGTEADYTKIDLKRAILLLAVPMILELIMESTFAVVDIFFCWQAGSVSGRNGGPD